MYKKYKVVNAEQKIKEIKEASPEDVFYKLYLFFGLDLRDPDLEGSVEPGGYKMNNDLALEIMTAESEKLGDALPFNMLWLNKGPCTEHYLLRDEIEIEKTAVINRPDFLKLRRAENVRC